MPESASSKRAELRKLLAAVLPTDSDFQAFCGDHFPETALRFANGMDRVAKTSLLLDQEDSEGIISALQNHDPIRFARHQSLLCRTDASASNPYRGLAAFQLHETHLFFGREALTQKLWLRFKQVHDRPTGARLTAILGPSGSGKSSVANAGLLAALKRQPVAGPQEMRQVVLKPGEHPVRALALALCPARSAGSSLTEHRELIKALRQPDASGAYDGLTLWAASVIQAGSAPLLLLIDQFEEIYTLCSDRAERDAFVGLLLHSASALDRCVSVVLTLRSDFLGETHQKHPELNRLIADQSVIVSAMRAEELRRAIAEPAAQTGHALDDATIDLLLREAQGSDGVLPLLEFALLQVWEGMLAGRSAGTTLHAIGGVGGALAGKAQAIYDGLPAAQKALARRALVRLVQIGEGTGNMRRRVRLRDLCGQGDAEADVLAVLRSFAAEDARLVTLSSDGIETIAEVTHEALFEHWSELSGWIEESRGDRRFHDRMAEAARLWEEAGRPAGRLWRSPDLDLLRGYRQRRPEELSAMQGAFLIAGERQQQRENLLGWGATGAVALAVLVASWIDITTQRKMERERHRVESDRRRAEGQIASDWACSRQICESYLDSNEPACASSRSPLVHFRWLVEPRASGWNPSCCFDSCMAACSAGR